MKNKKLTILGRDPIKVNSEIQSFEFVVDSGVCLDCDWDGLLSDADIDTEWDEFKMQEIPYPICPKCGGGLDDYYPSSLQNEK